MTNVCHKLYNQTFGFIIYRYRLFQFLCCLIMFYIICAFVIKLFARAISQCLNLKELKNHNKNIKFSEFQDFVFLFSTKVL